MPDQTLIDDLKSLLDISTQRARATGNLIAGLKGVNSTINKASRVLNEYVNQNANLDEGLLAQTQQAFDSLQFRDAISDPLLPNLRRESRALAAQIGALKGAIAALEGEMVDVIRLDHAVQTLQNSPLADDDLAALMPALNQELQQAQARLGDEFGEALCHTMREMGIEIQGRRGSRSSALSWPPISSTAPPL